MNKSDKLLVSVYARHGDMCGCAPHCDTLHCASGHKSEDYVLVAKFAYLQEAIDYAMDGARRGVSCRMVSRIVPGVPFVREYTRAEAKPKQAEVNQAI